MHTFKIHPSDGSFTAGLTAVDAAPVLNIVQRLDCKDADVLCDDVYCFSIHLYRNGLWCIFQRRQQTESAAAITLTG